MRRILAAFVLSVLAAPPLAAQDAAQPVEILKPLEPWRVDFGAARCRALRSFGSADKPTILIIDQYAPLGRAAWTVAGHAVREIPTAGKGWHLTFSGAGGGLGEIPAIDGTFENYGRAMLGRGLGVGQKASDLGLPMDDGIAEPTGERIRWADIDAGRRGIRRLETGNLGVLFAMMKRCSDDLVRVWGLDPAVEAGLTRRAEPADAAALTKAIIREIPGINDSIGDLSVRVMINATGQPTACTSENMTIARNLDGLACGVIMKRGKFLPALDAAGAPVASYWEVNVLYR